MWSALENIALRESLPASLETGRSVHDILISRQLIQGQFNLHHLGLRRSKPYLLKQFYSLDTNAFLRWQNETRFMELPNPTGYIWPIEEWRGGLIYPLHEGSSLDQWLIKNKPSISAKLETASLIANRLVVLHRTGISHRNLSPSKIRIENKSLVITDFGAARYDQWDDLWTDSFYVPENTSYASPERLNGIDDPSDDAYAFGAILYQILTGSPVFNSFKRVVREFLPNMVKPDSLPQIAGVPAVVRTLVQACLSPSADRPTIAEISSTLAQFGNPVYEKQNLIPLPPSHEGHLARQKIMVFIKDDSRTVPLFDAALRQAEREPSLFLFVGLVPGNLPSGHMERYKGNLFRKIAHGLLRCRSAGMLWSLRVLDNTVPEKTAVSLLKLYRPDTAFVGKTTQQSNLFFHNDFHRELTSADVRIKLVS